MELFQRNKNIMFEGIADIINDIVINGKSYDKGKLEQYFKERNINFYEYKKELLDDEDFVLYETKEGKILPRINLAIPYCLQYAEKQCLREIADDEIANQFLEEDTIRKIKEYIPEEKGNIYLYRNRQKIGRNLDNSRVQKNVRQLMQAILEKRMVRIATLQKTMEMIPYRLCYSNRNDEVQLLGIKKQEGIYISIEKIEEIELLDVAKEVCIEQWLKEQKRQLQLQIEDKSNAVERCFSMFSHLKKRALYDRKRNQYQMDIEYYVFEEKELIKDLLSLGSNIVVVEPQKLRNEMITIIKEIIKG